MLIFKERLPEDTLFNAKVELPFSSAAEARKSILKLDIQYGEPVFWYQTDAEKGAQSRKFSIVAIGTGHDWGDSLSRDEYIGTLLLAGGSLILHYFLVDDGKIKGLTDVVEEFLEGDSHDEEFSEAENPKEENPNEEK